MTTQTKALKLALEVMRNQGDFSVDEWIATEKAIKEALAQPEQEPVAWMHPSGGVVQRLITGFDRELYTIPLYTTPPQPKETEHEPELGGHDVFFPVGITRPTAEEVSRKPEQEPVAVYGYCPECGAKGVIRERRLNGNDKCASGHTYPSREAATLPQRKPLTDEQIAKCMISVDDPIRWGKLGAGCEPMVKQFARAIEAAHGIKGQP